MPTIGYVYIDDGYMDIVKLLSTKQLKQANSIDSAIKQTTKVHRTRRRNQLERKFENSRSYKQLHSNADTWVKNISDQSEGLKLQYERRCQIRFASST